MDAIDCMGFAGGFTLGTVQAGFRLVGKREHSKGFGVNSCENNRHLLGNDWQAEASDASEWTPYQVPYVFGNPPCSGFSLMSDKNFRGPDSPINSCMWDFVTFASRCNCDIMVFESVTQAFKIGLGLMRSLRAHVEKLTGDTWHLTHLLHNNYGLGGAAVRKRYFFVCHRVPFGIERYVPERVPVVADVLSDLQGLQMTWDPQPYVHEPTWWSAPRRSPDWLVDGHIGLDTPATRRARDLMEAGCWGQRESLSMACANYYAKHGTLPDSWKGLKNYDRFIEQMPKPEMGYHQPFRWSNEQACRVVTGGALHHVIHPVENRQITHREAMRIQGFPDNWRVADIRGRLEPLWGKGIPVDCGRWVSTWVKRAINGEPGSVVGEPLPDAEPRELVIDTLRDHWHLTSER